MSIVEKILDSTQFTEEIFGLPFVLRKITAAVAAEVIGTKTLGLMRTSGSKEILKDETIRITKGYLSACMVSPKYGEETDAENDSVSFADLGSFPDLILSAVFRESGFNELGKHSDSSEDTEGGS